MDIVEGQHLEGTEVQLLVGIDISLEHLDRARGNHLEHPVEEHLDSLVQLGMQEAIEDRLQDTELLDRVKLKDMHLAWLEDMVACKAILRDRLVIKDKRLDNPEEDIAEVVIEDMHTLEHHLQVASNSLAQA